MLGLLLNILVQCNLRIQIDQSRIDEVYPMIDLLGRVYEYVMVLDLVDLVDILIRQLCRLRREDELRLKGYVDDSVLVGDQMVASLN